jgi:hypothetical protein
VREAAFMVPHRRRDDLHHGGPGLDPRQRQSRRSAPPDAYFPEPCVDSITVKTSDFQLFIEGFSGRREVNFDNVRSTRRASLLSLCTHAGILRTCQTKVRHSFIRSGNQAGVLVILRRNRSTRTAAMAIGARFWLAETRGVNSARKPTLVINWCSV